MKLIIQIPCLDEEGQLGKVLRGLPREVAGFDTVHWLVVDDGCTDATVDVARAGGVDYVVRLGRHSGLAAAFEAGLDAALKLGADVVVNIDADDQLFGRDIPKLLQPIVGRQADVVIGDRDVATIPHFSRCKRTLQRLGGAVVRRASGTTVPDVTSGLRAYTRAAALQVHVASRFSYTLETLVQAGKSGASIVAVRVDSGSGARPRSRLYGSLFEYVRRSGGTLVRVYLRYEPGRSLAAPAAVATCVAVLLFARVGYLTLVSGRSDGHVVVLTVAATAAVCGLQLGVLALLASELAVGRRLAASTLEGVRAIELEVGVPPSRCEVTSTGNGARQQAASWVEDTARTEEREAAGA